LLKIKNKNIENMTSGKANMTSGKANYGQKCAKPQTRKGWYINKISDDYYAYDKDGKTIGSEGTYARYSDDDHTLAFSSFQRSDYKPEIYLKQNRKNNIVDCIKFCEKKKGCKGVVYDIRDTDGKCATTGNRKTLDYYEKRRNLINKLGHIPSYDVYRKIKGKANYNINGKKNVSFKQYMTPNDKVDNDCKYYMIDESIRPAEPTRCFRNSEPWSFNKCKDECAKRKDCMAVYKRTGYGLRSTCCMADPVVVNKLDETGYFNASYKQ
jgi:hypothetical protein